MGDEGCQCHVILCILCCAYRAALSSALGLFDEEFLMRDAHRRTCGSRTQIRSFQRLLKRIT